MLFILLAPRLLTAAPENRLGQARAATGHAAVKQVAEEPKVSWKDEETLCLHKVKNYVHK